MNFLDKKEQVYDFQLTPYGKLKLSKGNFKPTYYAFFDDNIIYDVQYAGREELQNDTHTRIKQETQFLGTQVVFKSPLQDSLVDGGSILSDLYEIDHNKITNRGMIGDAKTLAESNNLCPAIKIVSYGNDIDTDSISQTDPDTGFTITQINLTASYYVETKDVNEPAPISNEEIGEILSKTPVFSDNRYIQLVSNNPLIYVEEMNTELLNENFSIEVYKKNEDSSGNSYQQLFFDNRKSNIKDGFLIVGSEGKPPTSYKSDSVEYYFSINKDKEISNKIGCKMLNHFNKSDYLIDLDYECDKQAINNVYYDIYGAEIGDPEACQD